MTMKQQSVGVNESDIDEVVIREFEKGRKEAKSKLRAAQDPQLRERSNRIMADDIAELMCECHLFHYLAVGGKPDATTSIVGYFFKDYDEPIQGN